MVNNPERRNAIALDDAYYYCRQLESGSMQPNLFTLCNAIHTLDLALEAHDDSPMPMTLCSEAWSRVRQSLFNRLMSSFDGYMFVYDDYHNAVEPGTTWPANGHVEFFPEGTHRKDESYSAPFTHLETDVINPVRWAFAESRQQLSPRDFHPDAFGRKPMVPTAPLTNEEASRAKELLEKLYVVCEEEACEGKKKAHRKWWQLYWEANTCPNRRRKHELQKQMVALQSIWGTPVEA